MYDILGTIQNKLKRGLLTVKDINNDVVNYIYRIPPDAIADDMLNVFGVIRLILFAGAGTLIHPAIGLIAVFIDFFIEEKVNEDYYENKVLPTYTAEIERVKKEISELGKNKSDNDKLDLLKTYLAELEIGLIRIKIYYRDLTQYRARSKHYERLEAKKEEGEILNIDVDQIYEEYYITRFNSDLNRLLEFSVKHAIRDVTDQVHHGEKVASRAVDSVADSFFGALKNKEIGQIREEIAKGRIKLSTVFKHVMMIGGAVAVGYFGGAITLFVSILGAIVWLVRRDTIKDAQRKQLLNELHSEMEIVEEKIKDSASNNDLKKKYQYIRLRREIQKTIDKINYGSEIVRPEVKQGKGGDWD
jgi:hypothetical protein